MRAAVRSPSHILNVNDNPASRYMITRLLERAGFTVVEAATGAEALKKVRDLPWLVVLDIKLPDMNGLDVCRNIKSIPETQRIKVLHTSAVFVATEYKVQSLECGADGYLSYPFEQEELIAIVRSLLRLTDTEQELRDRAEDLRAVNNRTNEFLAMLAHELRNPLAAIVSSLPLLSRREAADNTERTARDLIKRQTVHLNRLVDDLLDVARVTQGKIELRWEAVDLAALLQRVGTSVQQTKTVLRRQGFHLSVPAEPVYVRGDATRLEQVFANLVDNASKYTDEGGAIEVKLVGPQPAGEGSDLVQVTVRDTGIGMAAQTLTTIFDLFSQADVPLARSRGGLGIGLTLVRTLVERHGGTITARSDGVGLGSEFNVKLPALRDLPATQAAPESDTRTRTTPRRRVLLIEDNVDAQTALKCLLEIWGHEVCTAGDGLAGIEMALAQRPDIALVDIGLPTMDGYEVAREIRDRAADRAPVLVALTGYGAPEQRAKALEAGFDLHMVKPIEPDQLLALISDCAPLRESVSGKPVPALV
jgi:two-component system, sensor histidine kinase